MNQTFSIPIFLAILAFIGNPANAQMVTRSYQESPEDFPNPERGFYIPADIHAGKFVSLNADILKKNRTDMQKHGNARIRLANQNTWEEKTGYNKLSHFISVGLKQNKNK